MFDRINGWLHSIGPDGQHVRDRIFKSLGIPPGKDGDYGRNFGLNDKQRKQFQTLGHSDVSTAMKYLHLLTEAVQRPHQALSVLGGLRR